MSRDGNGAGWVRRMGSSSSPHMVLSYPIPAPPLPILTCMMGKIFLPHPCPLGPREALPHPIKLNFLLIAFSKNWIILLKCFARQYHKKTKISYYKINDSIVYKFVIVKKKYNVKIGTLFPTLLEKKKRQIVLLGRIK